MINEIQTQKKVVAITFDDGPNPIYTPKVLKIFSQAKGKATFFMIGEQMRNYPELVQQVAALGHEIGSHTYTHQKLSLLSYEDCLSEFEKTERLIEKLIGIKPTVFRPPFMDYHEDMVSLLQQKGYTMIGALNLMAQDWGQPGVDHILKTTRNVIKNGSILIFHDGYGNRSQTIKAIQILVAELTEQGY
ncbi:polysaccharide deacetylase family protein [Neobacillus sedimentimangrovi]|uniref:polysaccharide deacetylase family protein n=1 Tax=Neobacillus sedimentimangrovi TaxID=2699460 RepID=UPI0013D7F159|nr:polysaccharide deacetylase family protein [Neobacillus sedimentimangrovi]